MSAAAIGRVTAILTSSPRELDVEQLVGRSVRDPDGRKIGRIEEVIAELRGIDWVVVEVHLGVGAMLERLVDLSSLVPLLGKLARRSHRHHCLPWGQLDLTDPDRPRSFVRRAELRAAEG